jgi:hypothetical protein
MLVKEYLQHFNKHDDVTFIIATAVKDEGTPKYHPEYRTTPFYTISELEDSEIMNYYILNHKQAPIDWLSGVRWKIQFDRGNLISMLIAKEDDLELLLPTRQAKENIELIDKKIKKDMGWC